MYKRYYDGYHGSAALKNQGEIVVPESLETKEEKNESQLTCAETDSIAVSGETCKKGGLNLPFELDDLILIGILLFLLFDKDDCKKDDNNDIFLLIIVGVIIFSDIF